MKLIPIDSELELKPITKKDASEFFKLIERNRQYLREWLGWLDRTQTITDLDQFIDGTIQAMSKNKTACFLIWYKNKIAGIIELREIDLTHKKAITGYWLDEKLRGHGLMKKAARAIVNYGFKELQLNRIEIRCATQNTASQAIPQSLGFKNEGTLRDYEWLYDHFVDHVVFSMIAKEWK